MMTRTTGAERVFAALAIGVVALTGGCGGDDQPDAARLATTTSASPAAEADGAADAVDTASVTVKGFKFDPKVVRVKAGQAITWTNEEPDADHSIHDTATGLKGPDFGPNAGTKTFSHTYSRPGTIPYFCGIHNAMTGTIIVT